jgi:hypothetical protein
VQRINHEGYIAASSADPSIIKPADDERRAIHERENPRRFINPEAQVLFGAQGSISTRRVYDDYFFVEQSSTRNHWSAKRALSRF